MYETFFYTTVKSIFATTKITEKKIAKFAWHFFEINFLKHQFANFFQIVLQ